MIHIFQDNLNETSRAMLLFHGTGGDEYDLISLSQYYDSQAKRISFRGEVKENGMNRFFKRLQAGVFDQEDLKQRVDQFEVDIHKLLKKYRLTYQDIGLVGYSNGANFIASYLLRYDHPYQYAILHHPMIPHQDGLQERNHKVPILVLASDNDPMVSLSQTLGLKQILERCQFKVDMKLYHHAHSLSQIEASDAKVWLQQHIQ